MATRLIAVEVNGRTEWMADPPDVCHHGHRPVVQRWEPCPACGRHEIAWMCDNRDCDGTVFGCEWYAD